MAGRFDSRDVDLCELVDIIQDPLELKREVIDYVSPEMKLRKVGDLQHFVS